MTVDKSNLRRVILTEAEQFAEGFAAASNVKISGDFDKIMVSGMGGSALPANILRIYLNSVFAQNGDTDKDDDLPTKKAGKRKLGVFQNRAYTLPPEAYDKCLNIICSHSGNTEETISSFRQALDAGLPCVGISAGGKIAQMCADNDVPHVTLPVPFDNFQPRMATGHFVSAMLQILINAGLVPDCKEEVLRAAEKLGEFIPQAESQGKELAVKLVGTTPVVYSSTRFKALAMVWKIKINENAKVPAFWNFFPELNHNEFVGYTNPQSKFHVVMLRDSGDDPRNLKRFGVTQQFLTQKGIDVTIVDIPEGEIFFRIFATLIMGDWMTYHLALEYGQDPTPVDMVEDFKKALV